MAGKDVFAMSSIDALRSKDMYTGSFLPTKEKRMGIISYKEDPLIFQITGQLIDENPIYELIQIKHPQSPALFKIIDEIIVNACDHAMTSKIPVTYISITFDGKGIITVENNGEGIDTSVHHQSDQLIATKTLVLPDNIAYIPDVIVAAPHASSNHYKKSTNIKGGINGLGCKVCLYHSDKFMIETCDGKHVFRRIYNNCGAQPEHAVFKPAANSQYTIVKFLPAYTKDFSYQYPLSDECRREIESYVRLCAFRSAAYLMGKVQVIFNGTNITIDNNTLACMLAGARIKHGHNSIASLDENYEIIHLYMTSTRQPNSSYPAHVSIIIAPKNKLPFRTLGVINGVTSNYGSHIDYIQDLITSRVKSILATKYKIDSINDKNITEDILICFIASFPDAKWGGQSKEKLEISSDIMESYSFEDKQFNNTCMLICNHILEKYAAAKGRKTVILSKKYRPAYYVATTKTSTINSRKCTLLVAEGESALKFCSKGLQSNKTVAEGGPNFTWMGCMPIRGVIINAMKQVRELETITKKGSKIIVIRSPQLEESEPIRQLMSVLGLDYNKTYDNAADIKTLKYGRLLICVDQDLDGCGKIAPLILVFIWQFWPKLIENGYVCRFLTPLIRLYPKGSKTNPKEFYYQNQFDSWIASHPDWRATYSEPKYIKGLGGHESHEIVKMFDPSNFNKNIYKYVLDEAAAYWLCSYFGVDSDSRKDILREPVKNLSEADYNIILSNGIIPIRRVALEIDTKLYKNDALYRQIPGVVDGLNESKRKAIYSSDYFKSYIMETKVSIYAAVITTKTKYVHGETPLQQMLLGWMHELNPVNYFIPHGIVGDIHDDDSSSARYVFMSKSPLLDATFLNSDYAHYTYNYEEGEKVEPRYMVPTIPAPVFEFGDNVSEGWNHVSFGRCVNDVTHIIHAITDPGINPDNIDGIIRSHPLSPNNTSSKANIMYIDDVEWSVGTYIINNNTVIITSIPLMTTVEKYINSILTDEKSKHEKDYVPTLRDKLIISHFNHSTQNDIRIHFEIKPESLNAIKSGAYSKSDCKFDPIVEFFLLRKNLTPQLNYYNIDNTIIELKTYHDIIIIWVKLRRQLLSQRLERDIIISQNRIKLYESKIRYITINDTLHISSIGDDDVAMRKLQELGFDKMNSHIIERPGDMSTSDLLATLQTDQSFDYCLDMKQRDLFVTNKEKLMSKLDNEKNNLARLMALTTELPFPAASVMRSEYDKTVRLMT